MKSLINYPNKPAITRQNNEADEIETLANNLTVYFLTTYYTTPSSPRTTANNKPKKQNRRGKLNKAFSTSDIYSRKISTKKTNKENSNKSINTTRYEQQYNKFKQTCMNIEKTKNTLYKENILTLLDEKDAFMEENEKLLSMLKKAKISIKQYQNENKLYEKRLQFCDKMLSIEKMKNSYNDLHFEMNCFLGEEEDVKFNKKGRSDSNGRFNKKERSDSSGSLDFDIDFLDEDIKKGNMNNSSITFDNQFDDRNNERDELLDKLQLEMEVLKYKLLKKEKDDNDGVVNNVSNYNDLIRNDNYHGCKSDSFTNSISSKNNNAYDGLKEDSPKYISKKQNEQVKQQMNVVNDMKERLEIEMLVCDIFHLLATDLYYVSNNELKKGNGNDLHQLSLPAMKLQTIDENIIYVEESQHNTDNDDEQLEIDLAVTNILSKTLIKVQSSNNDNIIQLKKEEELKVQLYKSNTKENLEIERMSADVLFNLSHTYYNVREEHKCNQAPKSNGQTNKKLLRQSKNDLQMEIMDINLLIADIIVTLSSYNMESIAKAMPSHIMLIDKNNQQQMPKKAWTTSNAPIINNNIVIDSKETIQYELIEIDMTVSEIYLMMTLDIQEDKKYQSNNIPPLLHPITLDYHTYDNKEPNARMKKERFTIDSIVADLSFSLASKSCEISYCHHDGIGNEKIDISMEVLASEQLLLYVLHNKEHRMNEINYYNILSIDGHQNLSEENLCVNILASDISYTLDNSSGKSPIETYYVHKHEETVFQESFYNDKHHYDNESFDNDYPQEQIFMEKTNDGVLKSFMSWFRRT